MLQKAAELVQQQGYTATGLNQILAESNAPKGSLYFHFPGGKEALVAEALQSSSAALTQLIEMVLAQAPTSVAALEAIVMHFAQELELSSFKKGCPIATVALEQAAISDPLHEVCSQTYARWQAAVAARLERDGHAHDRAVDLAGFLLSTIEGALLLSRTHRSTEPLRQAARELRRILERKPER